MVATRATGRATTASATTVPVTIASATVDPALTTRATTGVTSASPGTVGATNDPAQRTAPWRSRFWIRVPTAGRRGSTPASAVLPRRDGPPPALAFAGRGVAVLDLVFAVFVFCFCFFDMMCVLCLQSHLGQW